MQRIHYPDNDHASSESGHSIIIVTAPDSPSFIKSSVDYINIEINAQDLNLNTQMRAVENLEIQYFYDVFYSKIILREQVQQELLEQEQPLQEEQHPPQYLLDLVYQLHRSQDQPPASASQQTLS